MDIQNIPSFVLAAAIVASQSDCKKVVLFYIVQNFILVLVATLQLAELILVLVFISSSIS